MSTGAGRPAAVFRANTALPPLPPPGFIASEARVPLAPRNKVIFSFFFGESDEPPDGLSSVARPGDVYVSSHASCPRAGAGVPIYQRCHADWKRLVDGLPGQAASSFRHPEKALFALRFLNGDKLPRYISHGAWNRKMNRDGKGARSGNGGTSESPSPSPTAATAGEPSQVQAPLARNNAVNATAGRQGQTCLPRHLLPLPAINEDRLQPSDAFIEAHRALRRNVREMLNGPDAVGDFKFTELQYPEGPPTVDFRQQIDALTSKGHVVCIRKFPILGGGMSWDGPDDFLLAVRPVTIQSQHLGLESDDDKISFRLSEFMDSVSNDPDPSMDSWRATWSSQDIDTPWFLRGLHGDGQGVDNTLKLGLATPTFAMLCMDMLSFRGEVELSHGYHYVTDHISPEGTGRFIRIHEGRQEIQYFRPDPEPKSLEAIQACIIDHVTGKSSKGYCYSVTLHPGDILVLPPCTVHRTYTAAHTIAEHKHFYAWDMLHLTELALKLNVEHGRILTDSQHPSSFRLLARMAISTGWGREDRLALPVRSLHALARIMRDPNDYIPRDDERVAKELKEHFDSLPWREHRADVLLGRTILELVDVIPGIPDMEADYDSSQNGGHKWDTGGPRQNVKHIPLDKICSRLHELYCTHMQATGLELSSIPPNTMDELRLLVKSPPSRVAKRPHDSDQQEPVGQTTASHDQSVERAAKKVRFTE